MEKDRVVPICFKSLLLNLHGISSCSPLLLFRWPWLGTAYLAKSEVKKPEQGCIGVHL